MVWTLFLLYSPFLAAPSPSQGATDYLTGFFKLQSFLRLRGPFAFKSALYVHDTQHMYFHTMHMLHSMYAQAIYRQVPLCSLGEMAGWSKLQGMLWKQPFLSVHFLRERRRDLPVHMLGLACCCHASSPAMTQRRGYCIQFCVLEFGICLPALQAWRVRRSSGLPVVLTEHH